MGHTEFTRVVKKEFLNKWCMPKCFCRCLNYDKSEVRERECFLIMKIEKISDEIRI